jgi:hypothetical protein
MPAKMTGIRPITSASPNEPKLQVPNRKAINVAKLHCGRCALASDVSVASVPVITHRQGWTVDTQGAEQL